MVLHRSKTAGVFVQVYKKYQYCNFNNKKVVVRYHIERVKAWYSVKNTKNNIIKVLILSIHLIFQTMDGITFTNTCLCCLNPLSANPTKWSNTLK